MLSPSQILEYWEICHQELDASERVKFWNKPEILQLSVLPSIHVRRAIQENRKLEAILKQAMGQSINDELLTDLERLNVGSVTTSNALVCEHGKLTYEKCTDCRTIRPITRQKIVWLSGGGGKFHYDRYCRLAQAGQEYFSARGGNPLHWYSSSENAVKWSRDPCNGCVINKPLSFSWLEDE